MGSEMCIRDRIHPDGNPNSSTKQDPAADEGAPAAKPDAAPAAPVTPQGPTDAKPAEKSSGVSSESAPKELNSGTPAASNVSL